LTQANLRDRRFFLYTLEIRKQYLLGKVTRIAARPSSDLLIRSRYKVEAVNATDWYNVLSKDIV